jgi:tetratricopeptide (TPR) repeat protein
MQGDYAFRLIALGDIDVAQDQLDRAEKNYRESLKVYGQLSDAHGIAQSTAALASLSFERNQLEDAESKARTAADAFRDQKDTDLETDALATLVRVLLAENKLADARTALDRAKALPTQDQGLRLKLATAEASVLAREGKNAEATRMLHTSIQTAADMKLTRYGLESRLAMLEIDSHAGGAVRPQARALETDATASGFALIARKTALLVK